MFKRICIANRGEIALRIGRTCSNLGIDPLYLYESADKSLPHAKTKDSILINSYMDPKEIVQTAVDHQADAIHPGYGFLSESPDFVKTTLDSNIEFIGPSYQAMEKLGNKQQMLKSAQIAFIPHIPGKFVDSNNINEIMTVANDIGFPLILKGKESGGGRQIKILYTAEEVGDMVSKITGESKVSEIYVAKFLINVKHIEVQILGDKHGNVVSLGTRDCSIQRRFQKLIEEAPASLSPVQLESIEQAAIDIVLLVDYVCASTVEFLVDNMGNYFFMEVNPRLQVEHCVTEEIFNLDIVEQQIKIANGEEINQLPIDKTPEKHSIQCRINAEDPYNNFLPNPGKLNKYIPPKTNSSSIRYESFLEPNITIPSTYDSLIAKIIVTAKNRKEAINLMQKQLKAIIINGFPTTIPFFQAILANKSFQQGNHKTNYLKLFLPELLKQMSKIEVK